MSKKNQNESYSIDTLIDKCLESERNAHDVYITINDEYSETHDYVGLVTFVTRTRIGAWFKDQITGECIFLSNLIHDHQGGVDWKVITNEAEAANAIACVKAWHKKWLPVDSALFENAAGLETLRMFDSESRRRQT